MSAFRSFRASHMDEYVRPTVDLRIVPRRDDDGRGELLDDRWAYDLRPRPETVPGVDCRAVYLTVTKHHLAVVPRLGLVFLGPGVRELGFRDVPDGRHAELVYLDRLVLAFVRVLPLVFLVEAGRKGFEGLDGTLHGNPQRAPPPDDR